MFMIDRSENDGYRVWRDTKLLAYGWEWGQLVKWYRGLNDQTRKNVRWMYSLWEKMHGGM